MSDYGVTSVGFIKKRFDEIYNELNADIQESLDIDISLNPQSVINVITATYADRLARLWDLAEAVYLSQFPSSATGIALDNACSYANIKRKIDVPTEYYVRTDLAGTESGVLPVGTQAVSQGENVRYMTSVEACDMAPNKPASYWFLSSPDTAGVHLDLWLGGIGYHATSSGAAAADNYTMWNALKDLFANNEVFSLLTTAADANSGLKIIAKGFAKQSIGFSGLVLKEYGAYAIYTDDNPGEAAYNGPVTVTTGLPVLSAECITHSIGLLYESDEDLRKRYLVQMKKRGSASVDAIRAAVMSVKGVGACDIEENTTNSADPGDPYFLPHSVKIYVDAETGSTYDAYEVGKAIFDSLPAGIGTTYAVECAQVTVYDYAGNAHSIRFLYPDEELQDVQITVTSDGSLDSNYVAIAQRVFMDQAGDPKMGDAVDLQAIAIAIKNETNGAAYVEIACKENNAYTQKYLPGVSGRKYAFSASHITVQLAT